MEVDTHESAGLAGILNHTGMGIVGERAVAGLYIEE